MDVTARLFTWADRTLSHGRGRVWCGPWSRFELGFKQSKLKKNIPGRERSIRKYTRLFFFFFELETTLCHQSTKNGAEEDGGKDLGEGKVRNEIGARLWRISRADTFHFILRILKSHWLVLLVFIKKKDEGALLWGKWYYFSVMGQKAEAGGWPSRAGPSGNSSPTAPGHPLAQPSTPEGARCEDRKRDDRVVLRKSDHQDGGPGERQNDDVLKGWWWWSVGRKKEKGCLGTSLFWVLT